MQSSIDHPPGTRFGKTWIAAQGHAYRRWWIVLTPPHLAPSDLHRSLNCRDTILALERQINDGQQLSPAKEIP